MDSEKADAVSLVGFEVSEGEANSDFTVRLEQLAAHLGVSSDQQIAERLGVSKTTVFNWRHGVNVPYPRTLDRIARRAHVRFEWLALGKGEMLRAGPVPQLELPSAGSLPDQPAQLGRLQDQVALEDLVVAYEAAQRQFAARGVTAPDARKLLALTLAIYDAAMQAVQDTGA